MNHISSRSSYPGVNHESTAMIWKQRPSYPNGSWLALHAQRRCSKVEPRSRPFQLSFLIVVHYEYVPLGQTINKEYCANALLWLGDAIRLKWPQLQATGDRSFITTMCLPMHHISCRDFCETSNHPGDSAPLQPRFGALRLLAFPKTKITFEREEIRPSMRFRKIWWGSCCDSNKGFCRVFQTVEEMLGELCEVPRCLHWSGLRHHCPIYNVSCILCFLQ